ncbi:hypothetical protein [Dictyobacter arantiisoli]|uniref:Uncharacterized protein n=1 Tax=Dictyobacter arantiisoli TaxID=2014874 RepID=A0A5A5THV5_9CHLR|nr:hypothetical protein [Dictyobacter arantiisoli]GCF11170.1 hypothetical protein KDI_47340 [Dictyobacter arantiisoli]
MDEHEGREMLAAALPIDALQHMFLEQGGFVVVWVDISERQDLEILAAQEQASEEDATCSWYYAHPGKHNMLLGLHIVAHQPAQMDMLLVFRMSQMFDQLSEIARLSTLWIVPGPPPIPLTGRIEMKAETFVPRILNVNGQGLFLHLPATQVAELRAELAKWKGSSSH